VPSLRSSPNHRVDIAIEELIALASRIRGLGIEHDHDDWVIITVGKESWPARVIARDAVSKSVADQLVTTEARGSKIIVANQLSVEATDVFARTNESSGTFGWSWLDRRRELQLNHQNATGVVHFDRGALAESAALPSGWRLATSPSDGPIRGRAGISYAAALLLDPAKQPSIRDVAAGAGMSHGAVGEAAKLLRKAGLILPDGRPEVPNLFWALAAVWGPTRITPVAVSPMFDQAKRWRANTDDLSEPGWALGGDDAAAAWGAPVFVAGGRPWIWVPAEADARRAERSLSSASWEDYAAVIAVPPSLLVCRYRQRPPARLEPQFLPTVHPLFLALELAQDPSRGREILDQWTPDNPNIHRVW
jgi:hypothetical protein